ncbi:MAG: hypothetical protein K2I98_00370 [Prevotella sp.]|nr:hypothetical protein [Prevotella sp.]
MATDISEKGPKCEFVDPSIAVAAMSSFILTIADMRSLSSNFVNRI